MSIGNDVEGMFGGGAPALKFLTRGTTHKGVIESAEVADQRDLDGKIRTWDDGSPRKQVVVTLATDERDPDVTDDDGTRRLFLKSGMLAAVRSALKAAGVKNLEVGGTLAVQYSDDGKAEKIGFNPPKIYVAQYKSPAPAVAAGVSDLL